SPQLFAARHALHRFSAPRHPPHALGSLPFVSPRRATTCLHPLHMSLTDRLSKSCPPAAPSAGRRRRKKRATALQQSHGADRDRTDDLRLAKPALSHLSYSPGTGAPAPVGHPLLVGLGRLELPTSSLSGMRSNHLSYRPGARKPLSELGGTEEERKPYLERR